MVKKKYELDTGSWQYTAVASIGGGGGGGGDTEALTLAMKVMLGRNGAMATLMVATLVQGEKLAVILVLALSISVATLALVVMLVKEQALATLIQEWKFLTMLTC